MGVWWDDPRYLDPTDRGSWQKMAFAARAAVQEAVEYHAGHPAVLGFVLGNEIPGPVVRWHGRRRIEELLRSLYETGKAGAPEALFSYANFPTTQYLDTSYFDFDCFNVFLENESAYRRYLAQLQVSTGDRPLLLTELGLHSGVGEDRQADCLDWQLRGAMELGLAGTCVFSWTDDWWVGGNKVEGWEFGVTRENRQPKVALNVLEGYYLRQWRLLTALQSGACDSGRILRGRLGSGAPSGGRWSRIAVASVEDEGSRFSRRYDW